MENDFAFGLKELKNVLLTGNLKKEFVLCDGEVKVVFEYPTKKEEDDFVREELKGKDVMPFEYDSEIQRALNKKRIKIFINVAGTFVRKDLEDMAGFIYNIIMNLYNEVHKKTMTYMFLENKEEAEEKLEKSMG